MKRTSTVRFIVIAAAFALAIAAAAEAAEKTLSKAAIQKLEQSFTLDAGTQALVNAITNNDVRDLVYNRDLYIGHDDLFAHVSRLIF